MVLKDVQGLSYKEIAEVIAVEDGSYVSYPFTTWTELSEFRKQFE